MGALFSSFELDRLEDLYLAQSVLRAWGFRGQPSASWTLATSFQRAAASGAFPVEEWRAQERFILAEFRARAHLHVAHPPDRDDVAEWMALLQHHGGPTRMLDFTHSLYIAAFFAVDGATEDAAVWALNPQMMSFRLFRAVALSGQKFHELFKDRDVSSETVNRILRNEELAGKRGVVPYRPVRFNERLAVQQGYFYIPIALELGFMDNLLEVLDATADDLAAAPAPVDGAALAQAGKGGLIKLVIPKRLHKKVRAELQRMNISSASLFPGLDGFARSLKQHVDYDK